METAWKKLNRNKHALKFCCMFGKNVQIQGAVLLNGYPRSSTSQKLIPSPSFAYGPIAFAGWIMCVLKNRNKTLSIERKSAAVNISEIVKRPKCADALPTWRGVDIRVECRRPRERTNECCYSALFKIKGKQTSRSSERVEGNMRATKQVAPPTFDTHVGGSRNSTQR